MSNYAFCTCMGYFNTGLPCEHSLLVAVTHNIKFLLHSRWYRKFEPLMHEMEDNSRNDRIDKIHSQVLLE